MLALRRIVGCGSTGKRGNAAAGRILTIEWADFIGAGFFYLINANNRMYGDIGTFNTAKLGLDFFFGGVNYDICFGVENELAELHKRHHTTLTYAVRV